MSYAQWTVPAERDAEDIYGWIAVRDGRMQTAKNILREIRQVCDEYGQRFSSGTILGTERNDLGENLRVF